MIYFDHNATTPMLPEARQAWLDATEEFVGNPSSPHRIGGRADTAITGARQRLADFLGVDPVMVRAIPSPPSCIGTVRGITRDATNSFLRQLTTDPLASSMLRDVVSRLPATFRGRLVRAGVQATNSPALMMAAPGEADLLSILAGRREFVTRVAADWTPRVSAEESWQIVRTSMREAGY